MFAHPRSGSSSLYEILQLHPDLDILEEPFNENFTRWAPGNKDYLSLIHDVASLDVQLARIFETYQGIKLLDYQLGRELADHLLLRPDVRIAFIRRRNLLQTVVSNRIAHQTGLRKAWDTSGPLEAYYAQLEPLDLDDLRTYVSDLRRSMEHYETILRSRPDGRVFVIGYEEFYFAPQQSQREVVERLWRFLDVAPFWSDRIEYYLRPESVKMNTDPMYSFIPNAKEIDSACGSDENGWLLKPASSRVRRPPP